MLNKKNIDLKIILAFATAYERLYKKGEITHSQLEEILSLIDHRKEYPHEGFKDNLEEIFPNQS